MKKILVLSDLSPLSHNALRAAAGLAQHIDGIIDLVNCAPVDNLQTQVSDLDVLSMPQKVQEKTRSVTDRLRDSITLVAPDVQVDTHVLAGEPQEVVSRYLEHTHPDFIVTGSRDLGWWSKFWEGGSVSAVVKAKAGVPLLVVHNEDRDVKFKNILVPTNGQYQPDLKSVDQLKSMQKEVGAQLKLLRVVTQMDFATEAEARHDLNHWAEKNGLGNVTPHYCNAENVADGIIQYANKEEVDLVAMLTADYSLLKQFVHHITEDVLRHADKPVLILKN